MWLTRHQTSARAITAIQDQSIGAQKASMQVQLQDPTLVVKEASLVW